ncbi:MAG TPA: hypothetical protein VJP85_14400 [Candidatus Baltobacteraceae bacterium]|nr:hypothetical protein [Candidatus Baltobacteraceae bacterium]
MKGLRVVITALAAFLASGYALAAVMTNERVPVSLSLVIPCTGENVTLQGDLHLVDAVTINANTVHFVQVFNPQELTGFGSSRAAYRGVGVTRSDLTFNVNGFPAQGTFVNNFRIIGQGRAANYMIHENLHVTVNANGAVTSAFDDFKATCT